MEQLILIIHVLAALGIVALILIQQGKGADMGASFGAGASQTLFGSGGGGNVLTKATAILATIFFVTSFGLAIVAKEKAGSLGNVDINLPVVVEGKEPVTVAPKTNEGDIPSATDDATVDELAIPDDGGVSDIPVDVNNNIDTSEDVPDASSSDASAGLDVPVTEEPQKINDSGIPE